MKKKILFFALSLMLFMDSYGKNLMMVSAAVYKKPIQEISSLYKKEKDVKMDLMFGNMSQVINYVKNTDDIKFVVGDKKFLDKWRIQFQQYRPLGKGVLALAYRKGLNCHPLKYFKQRYRKNTCSRC